MKMVLARGAGYQVRTLITTAANGTGTLGCLTHICVNVTNMHNIHKQNFHIDFKFIEEEYFFANFKDTSLLK